SILQEAAGRIKNLHIHHSSVAPAKKREAEEASHGAGGACIICTSTLELGIDIGDLDIVVQVGPPDSVSSFLQRMGRSGRRDQSAFVAWLLADPKELLTSCAVIECAREKRIEPLRPPEKPWNVLVQQIFLHVLSASRAGRGTIVRDLLSLFVFSHFSVEDVDRLLSSLVSAGYLSADGEMLVLGPEAERVFGRSNYRELYSVIPGGGEYRVVTPDGEVVGSLDARFAHRTEPGNFTLGGATWSVVKCDESHNLVVVVPGGHNKGISRVFWSAGGEAALSPVICGAVQRIIARGGTDLPLSETDAEALREAIGAFPASIGEQGLFVRKERGHAGPEVVVYSFAGSRINQVLALLLRGALGRGRVRYDDYRVRVFGAGKAGVAEHVADALHKIPALPPGEASAFLPLPAPDPWKFARTLTEEQFRAMVSTDYYCTADVLQALARTPVVVLHGEEPGPGAGA
ncbi:MAG: helicase-related protein, partial [Methanoregula sp.]